MSKKTKKSPSEQPVNKLKLQTAQESCAQSPTGTSASEAFFPAASSAPSVKLKSGSTILNPSSSLPLPIAVSGSGNGGIESNGISTPNDAHRQQQPFRMFSAPNHQSNAAMGAIIGTSSTVPITGKFPNNRANQTQKTATDLIVVFVKRILEEGGYVDAKLFPSLLNENIIGLRNLNLFREIQQKSYFIDASIDVYRHGNHIRFYSDLERFIVDMYSRYSQDQTIDCFEKLGVGSLCRHPKVAEMFGSERGHYVNVTRDDLIKYAFEYALKIHNPATADQQQFEVFLYGKLKKQFNVNFTPRGFYVDFANALIHKIKRIQQKTEGDFLESQRKVYFTALQSQIVAFQRSNYVQHREESPLQQLIQSDTMLKPLLDELLACQRKLSSLTVDEYLTYMIQDMSVIGCVEPNLQPGVVVKLKRPVELLAAIENSPDCDLALVDKNKWLKNHGILYIFVKWIELQSNIANCHKYYDSTLEYANLINSVAGDNRVDDAAAIGAEPYSAAKAVSAKILLYMQEHAIDSIAQNDFDNLLATIRSMLNRDVVVATITAQEPHVGIDKDLLVRRIRSTLSVTRVQGTRRDSYTVKACHFRAIATAAIILLRTLLLDSNHPNRDPDDVAIEVLSRIATELSDQPQETAMRGIMSVIPILAKAELDTTRELQIPAFGCRYNGSFLDLLSSPELQHIVESIAVKCIPAAITSLDGRHNSKEDVAAVKTASEYSYEYLLDKLRGVIGEMPANPAIGSAPIVIETTIEFLRKLEAALMVSLGKQDSTFVSISGGSTFLSFLAEAVGTTLDLPEMLLPYFERDIMQGTCSAPSEWDEDIKVAEGKGSFVPCLSSLVARRAAAEYLRVVGYESTDNNIEQSLENFFQQSLKITRRESNFHVKDVMKLSYDTTVNAYDESILKFDVGFNDPPLQDENVTEVLQKLIVVTPFGCSCAEYCQWNTLKLQLDIVNGINEGPNQDNSCMSLFDFMLQNEVNMKSVAKSRNIVFHAIDANDCIPLPTIKPSNAEVVTALITKQYSLLASWCLSAIFQYSQNSQELFEFLKLEFIDIRDKYVGKALEKEIDLMLRITFSVPLAVQVKVFEFLLNVIAISQDGVSLTTILKTASFVDNISSSIFAKDLLLMALTNRRFDVCSEILKLFSSFQQVTLAEVVSFPRKYIGEDGHVETTNVIPKPADSAGMYDEQVSASVDRSATLSAATEDVSSNIFSKQDIIDSILAKRFKEDEGSEYGQMLQCALTKLSRELYSSEVHFVSELVQNADDNTYAFGYKPTLHMVLYPKSLHVYNNEIGFNEANIDAIANINASTKLHQAGFIGQKGIGFKSVFSVSDSPEIHSNGFHIRFDRNFMVKPIWINSSQSWPTTWINGEHFETCIRLQFDDATISKFLKLTQSLDDVFDPRLMLFLKQLGKLVLHDTISNTIREHCRHDISSEWIRIEELVKSTSTDGIKSSDEQFWFVKKSTFLPTVSRTPSTELADTTVAIAVKFRKNENSQLVLDFSDNLQPLYSFLPTKTTLFKFVVQGDFNLISSRERLLDNNEWNMQLLGEIPKLLIGIIHEMVSWLQQRSSATASTDVGYPLSITPNDILNLLPAKLATSDRLYCRLVDTVYAELRSIAFLHSSQYVMMLSPNLCVVHHLQCNVSDYLPEDVFFRASGCRYLHESLHLFGEGDVAINLQVRVLDEAMLVRCIESLASRNDEDRVYIGSLLVMLATITSKPGNTTSATLTSSSSSSSKGWNRGNHLVPSQVIHRAVVPEKSPSVDLDVKLVQRLARLVIWPDQQGTMHGLTNDVLWIEGPNLTKKQRCCLELLSKRILGFNLNALVPMSTKDQDKDMLRKFVAKIFKPNSKNADAPGGIDEIKEETVLRNIVLPLYGSETDHTLDRWEASACLALYHMFNGLAKLNYDQYSQGLTQHGIRVPVLQIASSNARKVGWHHSQILTLKYSKAMDIVPERAIHLGGEFPLSATNKLIQSESVSTALAQLAWSVVDPLVAALCVLDGADLLPFQGGSPSDDIKIMHNQVQTLAASVAGSELQSFYRRIGVVNFFSPYLVDGQYCAPHLLHFIDWITQHGQLLENMSRCVDINNSAIEDGTKKVLGGVYFPDSSRGGLLGVSKDVFKTMMVFADLINEEMIYQQSKNNKCYDSASSLVHTLSQKKWLPVTVDKSVYFGSPEAFALAAPCCAFERMDSLHLRQYSSFQTLFAVHRAYVAVSPSVVSYLPLAKIPNDITATIDMFLWMSNQGIDCYSSIKLMIDFYAEMHGYLLNVSANDSVRRRIQTLLDENQPFLWIPSMQCEEKQQIVKGRFYPLSETVVQFPPVVGSVDSPFKHSNIHGIATWYSDIMNMFAVPRPCWACQAIEGRFGAKGGAARVGSGKHSCLCSNTTFGSCLFPPKGLVSISPSLQHVVSTAIVLVSKIEAGALKLQLLLMQLLESLSRNIWNTFNIPCSLHPYAAQDLIQLRTAFTNNKLLPTQSGDFVSLQEALLVIDDQSLFNNELLKQLCKDNGRVCLICSDRIGMSDLETEEVDYNIDRLRTDESQLLNLTSGEFHVACSTIQEKTFFAPPGLLSLYKFLGISTLSQYCERQWNLPQELPPDIASGPRINDFLYLTQTCVLHCIENAKFVGQNINLLTELQKSKRISSVQSLKFLSCDLLREDVTVRLQERDDPMHLEVLHPYYMDKSSNRLLISSDISMEAKDTFLQSIILSALSTEVAITCKNQNSEAMMQIETHLKKFAKASLGSDGISLVQYMKAEALQTFPEEHRWHVVIDDHSKLVCAEPAGMLNNTLTEEEKKRSEIALAAFQTNMQTMEARDKVRKAKAIETRNVASLAATSENNSYLQRIRDEIIAEAIADGGLSTENPANIAADKQVRDSSFGSELVSHGDTLTPLAVIASSQKSRPGKKGDPHNSSVAGETAYTSSVDNSRAARAVESRSDEDPVLFTTVKEGHLTDRELVGVSRSLHHHGSEDGHCSDQMDTISVSDAQSTISVDASVLLNRRPHRGAAIDRPAPATGNNQPHNIDRFCTMDEDWQYVLGSSPTLATSGGDTTGQFIPTIENLDTGVLGEKLAYSWLRRQMKEENVVTWLNEETEQNNPYDFIISDALSKDPIWTIEVKTRIRHSNREHIKQWFMSANEVVQACKQKDVIFACLLISVDKESRQAIIVPVGWENGLHSAILNKEARLLLQLS